MLGTLIALLGSRSAKRRLLMNATQSVLFYFVEVWAEALSKEVYRKDLEQVLRWGAL